MRRILAAVYGPDKHLVRNLVLRDRVLFFGWGLLVGGVGIVILLAVLASANP